MADTIYVKCKDGKLRPQEIAKKGKGGEAIASPVTAKTAPKSEDAK